ncbi:MAG: hypothetical protein HY820_26715 [Acidobacteria bacterium]|nr:hypothetical protein [Acidobacteriota bacterium]
MMRTRNLIVLTSLLLVAGHASAQEARVRPLPDLDKNMKTGPAIGSKIPSFDVTDHMGRRQTFESLRGSKGLVLLFIRSADW